MLYLPVIRQRLKIGILMPSIIIASFGKKINMMILEKDLKIESKLNWGGGIMAKIPS